MDGPVRVLKIGGSLVTDKHRDYVFSASGARRVADELAGLDGYLVVVHGTGSFGKPPARQYQYLDGFISRARADVVAEVQGRLDELRAQVLAVFRAAGLPAFGVAGASVFRTRGGVIDSCSRGRLEALLDRRVLPVIAGDVVIDEVRDFVACSSDAMAAHLAVVWSAASLVFATDVDGVLADGVLRQEVAADDDVWTHPESDARDVSRGMRGKLDAAFRAADAGIPTTIVNGWVAGRVRDALLDRPVVGTRLRGASAKWAALSGRA